MLRVASYDIIFQEIPGEVTLALNISGCPNACHGCHSPHLLKDTGELLDEKLLTGLLEKYANAVTCICFMGGDSEPEAINRLAAFVCATSCGNIRTAWYSGRQELACGIDLRNFDYIKVGPYIERLGGLDSPKTNQRFYRVEAGEMTDITYLFLKNREFMQGSL